MGYAGLRIGEVEQLQRQDIQVRDGNPTMLHIRRGGSNGSTKDKDERFVPVHPKVAERLGSPRSDRGPIYCEITQRPLLKRLKALCKQCEFENPQQYKLHSVRHHFASLCANNRVAHRKALVWLGHNSSDMLDLYYHLHDEDSLQAMQALADEAADRDGGEEPSEGNLRATEQSAIEKTPQALETDELVAALDAVTERAGFEPAVPKGYTAFPMPPDRPLRHLSGSGDPLYQLIGVVQALRGSGAEVFGLACAPRRRGGRRRAKEAPNRMFVRGLILLNEIHFSP